VKNKNFTKLSICLMIILFAQSSCDIRKQPENKPLPKQEKKKSKFGATSVEIIDSVHHFGTIQEGEKVTFNFRFKNIGKEPLEILEVMASCGCTVPEKPEEPIKPGEIGFIKATFNSDRKPGEAHKTIVVRSNANPEFPVLIMQGTVIGKQTETNP
jgi:hypothetical protein